jgi:hypothetical protein
MLKSFKQYLIERISDIVYHITYLEHIVDILKTDKFKLVPALGSSSELQYMPKKTKWYYMSFARSPRNKYFETKAYQGRGYFVLDGEKLSQRYSGKSIDYWYTKGSSRPSGPVDKDEMEDRLFSEKPFISNVKQYIKEIHFMVPGSKKDWDGVGEKFKPNLIQLIIYCKRNNIPLYFYDDVTPFLNKNTTKTVDVPVEYLKTKEPVDALSPKYSGRKRKSEFSEWLELTYKTKYEDLSDNAQRTIYYMSFGDLYYRDYITSLKNLIHNNKQKGEAEPLLDAFRFLKANTVEEFLQKIKDKWKRDKQ